ncbi:hypothetical protein [Sediminibacterium ginsengisoli]|uniref:YD repeat-containing protein n=1 Tax=Sediminibacterium ginsengisoli TaxID=413434 RepID=A0A1T4MIS0_9BACT|nr:hypothetical protein [Sediminibacterium ginsengisoli]SJZ66674.1 hypothetical protein SAMN04488132_103403 [Sediminibacterium ginsengisoli]
MKGFMRTGLLLICLAITTLVFTGCTKEGSAEIPGTVHATGNKISKLLFDDGSSQLIEYNTDKTIKTITTVNNPVNPGSTAYNFTYTGTKVTEINSTSGVKYKYTYTGTDVTKVEIFSQGGNMTAYYNYTYTNGQLTKTEGFFRIPGTPGIPTTPAMRAEYKYHTDGNLEKMSLYYNNPANNTMEKDEEVVLSNYDDKKNTTILFENNPFLPLNIPVALNNPGKEVHYDASGNVQETVLYTYTYDSNGNPQTRKAVSKSPGAQETEELTKFFY